MDDEPSRSDRRSTLDAARDVHRLSSIVHQAIFALGGEQPLTVTALQGGISR
jgi:hypothetical protein